jgi:glycosyltransferase involved in cell wall biosynthesis
MKTRIAHIQVLPILSGVQNISLNIFNSLDNNKYEKYLICSESLYETETFRQKFADCNVEIIRLKNLKREIGLHDIKLCLELYKLLKKLDCSIVHTHSTKPGIIGRICARLAKVRCVIHTIHGISFHKAESLPKRCIFYFLEVIASLFGHYLTSVNRHYLKYFKFLPSNRLCTIINGIDLIKNVPPRTPSDVKRILFLARLDEQKDPLTLIKAIEIISNTPSVTSNIKLTMAGDGELTPTAKRYVTEKGLERIVEFIGWTDDKCEAYRNADIFCVPSIHEAFGLVFAEAGLHGLPTVSTNVEGIPEVIIDGETGILVEPQAPQKLANALNILLNDPQLSKAMGGNARMHVLRNFDVKNMVKSYQNLYQKALEL